jgi:hypothetical protein
MIKPARQGKKDHMRRRSDRTNLVRRLVSPVAATVRRRIPRIRRQFPRTPMRWSLARRLLLRPAARTDRGGS